MNFDHLLVARLFLNCTLNRERFGMFEEVTKTLQMFNTSTIFDHELERLELLLKRYARHDAGEKVFLCSSGRHQFYNVLKHTRSERSDVLKC